MLSRVCFVRSRTIGALIFLAMMFGCSKDPAKLFESAKDRTSRGDRAGAIIDLKTAIQGSPNDAAMRYALGRLYNDTFDGASAEKELRKALEFGAIDGGRVLVELARALRAQGKFKEILSDVKPASVYEPDLLASIHALRGRAEHALLDPKAATESLSLARKAEPNNNDVALLDAQIKAGTKDFSSALALVETVLSKDAKHFDALTYKAEILRAQGNEATVLDIYQQVLGINPNHFRVLLSRSSIYLGQGRLDLAQKDVDSLKRQFRRHPLVIVQQGVVDLASGKHRDALEAAQTVLKNSPDIQAAHLLAGLAHSALGSALQAEQILSKVVAENPRAIVARKALAESLLQLNRPRAAMDVVMPLVRADAGDAHVFSLLGDAHMRLGDNSAAVTWFEKAAGVRPDDPEFRIKQSVAQMGAGKLEEGLGGLSGAVKGLKQSSRADELLILVHLSKGDFERAESAVSALEGRVKSDPVTLNLRGLTLLGKGEREKAASAFEQALKLLPSFLPAAKNLAQLDLTNGRYEAAEGRFRGVLSAEPKSIDALTGLADLQLRVGRVKDAVQTLETAVRTAPAASEPRARLMHLLLRAGDKTRAAALAEEVLARNLDESDLLIVVAQVLLANGKEHSASQTMAKMVRASSQSEAAHYQMARFQLSVKRRSDAENSLRRSLELRRGYPPALVSLTSLLVDDKRFEEAIALARSVQKEIPKAPIGYLIESEVHESRGKWSDAILNLRKALDLQPSGELAVKLFSVRGRSGDVSAAVAELQGWVEAHPRETLAHSKLADAMMIRGDYGKATMLYEKVLGTEAMTIDTLNNLAWAYHQTGDAKAPSVAARAYELAPNNASVADTYGWILFKRGDVAEALPVLRKAAELSPNEPTILYHYAASLANTGDRKAAKDTLTKAFAIARSYPESADASALMAKLK